MRRLCLWRNPPAQPAPEPQGYLVRDIRVTDDGFPLVGQRYAGFLAEVARRQAAAIAQDTVTVWPWKITIPYIQGTPRVNALGDLEVVEDDVVLGAVRKQDGCLYLFFP